MNQPIRNVSSDLPHAERVPYINQSELFTRHSDSVLCCSIDTNNRLAVTGGIDDTAFVWDLNTKHVIFECSGHRESVVAAAFSVNSTYVATGDLNGYIQVRNTTTGVKLFEYEIDEVNWIRWHNSSDFVLLAGTTKGDFWMWNVNDPAAVKTFPTYGSGTTSAKILADGLRIVVTYQDGSIRLFDLKSRQTIRHLVATEQAEIISLDVNQNNSLLAIGCIDATVKIITINGFRIINNFPCKSLESGIGQQEDSTSGLTEPQASTSSYNDESVPMIEGRPYEDLDIPPEVEPLEVIDEFTGMTDPSDIREQPISDDMIEQADDQEIDDDDDNDNDSKDNNSVESVLFSPCGNFLAASNNSGTMIIWDIACQTARCELHTGVGITRCAWTPAGYYVAGCLDGVVRIYDINLNLAREINAHSDQILDLANLGGTIVTASEDKTCRVIYLNS